MRNLVLVVVSIIILIGIIGVQDSFAQEEGVCAPQNYKNIVKNAGSIFSGTVISKEPLVNQYQYNVQFKINESFFGDYENFVNVTTSERRMVGSEPVGGDPFEIGEKYLVFAIPFNNSTLYAGSSGCNNSLVIPFESGFYGRGSHCSASVHLECLDRCGMNSKPNTPEPTCLSLCYNRNTEQCQIKPELQTASSKAVNNQVIEWNPPEFSLEAFPGAPWKLNFTSNNFIEKLEVKVSEEISGLVVSEKFLEKIYAQTSIDLELALFIPPESKEGWNNGTITLASEGVDLTEPMKLNIFVPTIYKEVIPREGGSQFVTVATPSHSQFSENTMNISQYIVLPNGTSFLMQVFYDVFVEPKQLPPLKQVSSGTLPQNVTCAEGFQLIFKIDNSPACVKPESIPKLIERGWAKSE